MPQCIHVPSDYPTIQQAIDAVNPGDTVLVSPGIYVENINFNGKKYITVTSWFLNTQDTSYISQTVIDGNQSGSVVTFNNSEDHTALLCGFTLKNGKVDCDYLEDIKRGGGITCKTASPILKNLVIVDNISPFGGGCCFLEGASPVMTDVLIHENTAQKFFDGSWGGIWILEVSGGGIYCEGSSPVLNHVTIVNNTAYRGGGICCVGGGSPVFNNIHKCDIYLNTACEGNDLYSDLSFQVIADTFSVRIPSSFHTYPLSNFSFDIQHGYTEQVNADLYVSPEGNNTNSGLSANEALRSIHSALSRILPDSLNQHTIHLAEGIYSPSSNKEFFPVMIPDYVNMEGVADTLVILDADSTGRVLQLINNSSSEITGMTLTGGIFEDGGGIYCSNSTSSFSNMRIIDNKTYSDRCSEDTRGGGVFCENSNAAFRHVTIAGNKAPKGGGIYFLNSSPELLDIIIRGEFYNLIHC